MTVGRDHSIIGRIGLLVLASPGMGGMSVSNKNLFPDHHVFYSEPN